MEQSPPSRKLTRRQLLVIFVGVIIISFFARQALDTIRPGWAFVGAYADYYNSGTLLTGTPYSYNVTVTVIAYNSSSAQLVTRANLTIGSVSAYNESTTWAHYGASPVTAGATNGDAYTSNTTLMHINGKDVQTEARYYRHTFRNITDTVTVFSSLNLGFPVAFRISYQDGNLDTYLTRTNIPGLLP
jgi:hypothetical protein